MEKERLPHKIDPKKLANQGQTLVGVLPLSDMSRLSSLTQEQSAPLKLTLRFYNDADNRCVIEGELSTELELTCQRCLSPMKKPIIHHFLLTPVRSEFEMETQSAIYEPVLLQEDSLVIADMVEDELLLQVPMIPKHDNLDECIDLSNFQDLGAEADATEREVVSTAKENSLFSQLQSIRQMTSKEN